MQPLGSYLAESMPPRTDPPGETHRYSNHGYALAAYVVEEVSGLPFDQYVAEQILQPLGMFTRTAPRYRSQWIMTTTTRAARWSRRRTT